MSLLTQRQAQAFLSPLRSRASIFVLGDREINLSFSRFLLECLDVSRCPGVVADMNAFYTSNAVRLATQSDFALENIVISLPPSKFDPEAWAIDFLLGANETAAVILDDLNTLYHLLSWDGSRRTNNRVTFIVALASFLARSKQQIVVLKAYSRTRVSPSRRGTRSLERLGDLGISVTSRGKELLFKCVKGDGWKDGTFSVGFSP